MEYTIKASEEEIDRFNMMLMGPAAHEVIKSLSIWIGNEIPYIPPSHRKAFGSVNEKLTELCELFGVDIEY